MGTAPPKEYIYIITMEQQTKGNLVTLKDLEAVMYQQWQQKNGPTEEQDNEMTFPVFEGYCYQCEQQGHKADACANRKF
jgi:hypothetical protein